MELSLRTLVNGREVRSTNLLLFLLPYIFALIFFVTTFTTSGFLLQSVAEEKEDRVIEIVATTVSPTQLMAGKIIGLTSVGLTQVSIWIGLAALAALAFVRPFPSLGSLQLPWTVLGLGLLYFLLGYLLIAACYAAAGAIVTTAQEAQTLVTPLSMLGIAPLMLVNVILTQPNGTLARIFSLIPFSAPMTMLLRLPVADVPSWQVALSLLTLALAAFGAVLLSARALRMSMTHPGRRLTLRDLAGQA
jgi:ABC-2 type transport system permease protein